MLNDETKRKLRQMNIGEFIDAIDLQDRDTRTMGLSFDERLQELVDSVYQEKYNNRVQRLVKSAKFRIPTADVRDILYCPGRMLNRNLMNELATCRFVQDYQSIIIQGYSSSGKSYLGCALGKEACRQSYRTKYIRLPDLLVEYDDASVIKDGTKKLLRKYASFRVLIMDEWLIADLSADELRFLFELSERRYDTSSTIFCTLYRKEDWLDRLGESALSESIVERYSYNSICLETGEMNMRKFLSK